MQNRKNSIKNRASYMGCREKGLVVVCLKKKVKIDYKKLCGRLRDKLMTVIDETEKITLVEGTYGHGYPYIDSYGNVQMGACWHPFVEVYADGKMVFEFRTKCDEVIEEGGINDEPFFEEIIDVLETVFGIPIWTDDNGDLYLASEFEAEDRVYISISGTVDTTDLHYSYIEINVQKIHGYIKKEGSEEK